MEGEDTFGRTHPWEGHLGKEWLRGASERDDGQMPPAANEPYFDLEGPCPTTCRVHRSLR